MNRLQTPDTSPARGCLWKQVTCPGARWGLLTEGCVELGQRQGAVAVVVIKSEEVTGRAPQDVLLQVMLLQHVLWVKKGTRTGPGVSAELWAELENDSGRGAGSLPAGGVRTPAAAPQIPGAPEALGFCLVRLSYLEMIKLRLTEGRRLTQCLGQSAISIRVCLLPTWADGPWTV